MTKRIGKSKKLSKAVNRERKALEAENSDIPKTMIFCKPNSSNIVKQLVQDFKSSMKPHTIKEIFCSKSNTLKDYISHATKIHVKNIIYFTHARSSSKNCDWNESTKYERGGVYCHMVVMPHGPSFTYRVKEYSLKRDIQTITGFGMNENWSQKPPLLICEGFGNSTGTDYLKAVSSSFQNMLPTLNINKMQINTVRRALLVSHQQTLAHTDEATQQKLGEVFVFRHYFIRLENKELNRNIRKLGVGVTSRNVKIPDMSKYSSIADFVSRAGNASESEMSDLEGEGATINLRESVKELPGSTGKTAVRLMEVGPRMTLQLIKIQEGVHSGALLYHRFVTRTKEEIFEMEKRRAERVKLKEKRREQQLKDVANKLKAKDDHKKVCLQGMKEKGFGKKSDDEEEEGDEQEGEAEVADAKGDSEGGEAESDGLVDDGEEEEEEIDDIEMEGVDEDDEEGMEDINDSLDEGDDDDDSDDLDEGGDGNDDDDSDDLGDGDDDDSDDLGDDDSDGLEGDDSSDSESESVVAQPQSVLRNVDQKRKNITDAGRNQKKRRL